jgi:hypothetical protein
MLFLASIKIQIFLNNGFVPIHFDGFKPFVRQKMAAFVQK